MMRNIELPGHVKAAQGHPKPQFTEGMSSTSRTVLTPAMCEAFRANRVLVSVEDVVQTNLIGCMRSHVAQMPLIPTDDSILAIEVTFKAIPRSSMPGMIDVQEDGMPVGLKF